ncbi:hypothetical protein PsYK624_045160 [Phanerochaete sordida]|uniref:Uncharacterized protein n=1 Tax=Phanerochaete sordida TaxID=48140 RepID=A0A9P3G526_9APHY|nr:hypothetical protein PsYK624_045160 [Phanerochaete sordida]
MDASLGYVYYAGVEYGDQCRCGAGFSAQPFPSTPRTAARPTLAGDTSRNMRWLVEIQLCQVAAATELLPASWAVTAARVLPALFISCQRAPLSRLCHLLVSSCARFMTIPQSLRRF